MDFCQPAIDLYMLAIWVLLIILCGQFLGVLVLVLRCARLQAKLELQKLGL